MNDDPGLEFIVPTHKLIISYDIHPASHDNYFRFVMNELVPTLQQHGIYMVEGWHTAYGDYPLRMVIFVTEDLAGLQSFLASESWRELESRFLTYIRNYSLSIVPYRRGFQFVR